MSYFPCQEVHWLSQDKVLKEIRDVNSYTVSVGFLKQNKNKSQHGYNLHPKVTISPFQS